MKTEFLKGLGLEQDVIDKIMAENGKDIAAEKAKTTKAEGERDNFKDQLATATESLEKFKDVDPTAMQGEIDKLNQQLKDKDAEYAAKEADRINYKTVKFLYVIRDGAEALKGVKINDQTAKIGDTVCFGGKRLFIERR